MKNSLVSILMPFKNTANYLEDCLESILMQDYPNWELMAVNDHSTDHSAAILMQYAQKDDRIRLLQNSGKGIIPALRKAYQESTGAYITRMDADDIMAPHKLSQLLKDVMARGKGHVALGQVKYFSDRGISDGYARYERWINRLTKKGENFKDIYKECVIPSPCWMVSRGDLDSCGAFDPDRYPEDYDLTFRFYEKGMKCIPSDQILHYWRDYDTRTSRTSEHYAQNYFLEIKRHYFLKVDHDKRRPLAVWGAGFKGKTLAKAFSSLGISFTWLCDNPKKIGKTIYGIKLVNYHHLEAMDKPQSLITVANASAQKEIRKYLHGLELDGPTDAFFFC